jgi:hypothetical protein
MTKARYYYGVKLSLSKLVCLFKPAFDKLRLTFQLSESERFVICVIRSLSKAVLIQHRRLLQRTTRLRQAQADPKIMLSFYSIYQTKYGVCELST